MDLDGIAFDRRFGAPVIKDGCGVFGILRKPHAPRISNKSAIDGISCIKYRGSNLGAGYAAFTTSDTKHYRIQAFITEEGVAKQIRNTLEGRIGRVESSSIRRIERARDPLAVWEATLLPRDKAAEEELERVVDSINGNLFREGFEGRIFSYGRYLNVYKEVGYPAEVASMWGLDKGDGSADMWIAHTRQPTNSPGSLPIWSHPFASMNTAIVHNGDISSYGSNMELLNSWGLKSHVGTDSEVIARLLDHLLRVEGLSIREAALVLTNPFERNLSIDVRKLLYKYRGARLDGPFAIIAGHADGEDLHLIALTDRSKFRPLLAGEDENNYYLASEENQIRLLSKNAKIWTPEPGAFFIASLRRGLIESGTDRDLGIQSSALASPDTGISELRRVDADGRGFREINEEISKALTRGEKGIQIDNCAGQRYLGIGISATNGRSGKFKIKITGFPGNCLANLNEGASFEVFGNVADDLADTMHSGSVTVHGNARDVVGQALQGGRIFVRGSVGNRAAIQMREYKSDRPFLVVGETADDYLGEYMAGGVVIVLNLAGSSRPARNYVGTGMVGGRMYIRGIVAESQIGLLPQREDVLRYLLSQTKGGRLSNEMYEEIANAEYPSVQVLSARLPKELMARVLTLFFSTKYTKSTVVERRKLDGRDIEIIGDRLQEFFEVFALPDETKARVLDSEYTIISAGDEKFESHVPPQETPVEE